MTWYYTLTGIAYAIFLIQFLLSMLGADTDVDLDFDADGTADLGWSDIFSFKGLIHFLMGFGGWLSLMGYNRGSLVWYDYIIAVALGVGFFMSLYYLGKGMLKLESHPSELTGTDLIGQQAKVTVISGGYYYICLPDAREFLAQSGKQFNVGDTVQIVDYVNGIYII